MAVREQSCGSVLWFEVSQEDDILSKQTLLHFEWRINVDEAY
jgi:hypothetical protein